MASSIENNVTDLYGELEDFLQSCLIRKTLREKPSFLRQGESLFDEKGKERFDRVFVGGAANTLENFAYWWEDQMEQRNTWIGITG